MRIDRGKLMEKLNDNSPCPVNGDNHGILMKNLDAAYLLWLYDQKWLKYKYPEVLEYIEDNMTVLESELE